MAQSTKKKAAVAKTSEVFDEEEETVEAVVRPGGQDVPLLYSNHVQMASSPWDFSLNFFQLSYSGGGGVPSARELIRVMLSPPQAKALRDLIARQVELYEQKYGEIISLVAVLAQNPD
jgi:hypothetical protein